MSKSTSRLLTCVLSDAPPQEVMAGQGTRIQQLDKLLQEKNNAVLLGTWQLCE